MTECRRWRDHAADYIYLSKPNSTQEDVLAVAAAVQNGWLAPNGPDLQGFEDDFAALLNVMGAVGLSSGTAALHLGLKYLGVKPGDFVLIPTTTFGATAFAVDYLGGIPVFIDVDESWNMDPDLIAPAVKMIQSRGGQVTAAIAVDLYGTPANFRVLADKCALLGIPLLEDAAEALGAQSGEHLVGSNGVPAVFSFNGNKILTTTSGGMLVSNDPVMLDRIRYWSTQSRELFPWYEHVEIGYNYRMSNVLAALGRSQLARLPQEVVRRRNLRLEYARKFSRIPGVRVQADPTWGQSNAWLTVVTFDAPMYPDAPLAIMKSLAAEGIEVRPTWKPMHQQPVFAHCPRLLHGRADRLFKEGLCLPSGADVTDAVVERITHLVEKELSTLQSL